MLLAPAVLPPWKNGPGTNSLPPISSLTFFTQNSWFLTVADRHYAVFAGSDGQSLRDGELLIIEYSLDQTKVSKGFILHDGAGPLSIVGTNATSLMVSHHGGPAEAYRLPSVPVQLEDATTRAYKP